MIFVDTGAFLARYVRQDQYHTTARKAWREVTRRGWKCFTSSFVLDETFTLLARRTSCPFAVERARNIVTSPVLEVLRPAAEDELRALELFEKFADPRVSFTDCVSFILMRRARLTRAFTFDSHFERAGFALWPARVGARKK